MQKNRIEVSKEGTGKTLYIPLCVFKASENSYSLACSDPEHLFKSGTTPEQLQKFKEWIVETFEKLINSN
jgi:hypothetical protein